MKAALAYDDILLIPQYSEVLPQDTKPASRLGNIELALPVISAAMDTVTEVDMAVAMAQGGGIGVIHQNMTAGEQRKMVRKVKLRKQNIIKEPICIPSDWTVGAARVELGRFGISGAPVYEQVAVHKRIVGMVTRRDLNTQKPNTPIKDVMTSRANLLTASADGDLNEYADFMRDNRIEKLPILGENDILKGMVTLRDLQDLKSNVPTLDEEGRYRVGAALGIGDYDNQIFNHVVTLIEYGVDFVVLDSAHGHSKGVGSLLHKITRDFPELLVVVGNIATKEAAKYLLDITRGTRRTGMAHRVVLKVGIGPGSICSTRGNMGVGYPQFSALVNCNEEAGPEFFIADGGINKTGSVPKALMHANTIMLGNMLAGTDEAPGAVTEIKGKLYKRYRGMGSSEAMEARKATGSRYAQKKVAEGVSALVPYKGSVHKILDNIRGALKASMGYLGVEDIKELQDLGRTPEVAYTSITSAAKVESDTNNDLII